MKPGIVKGMQEIAMRFPVAKASEAMDMRFLQLDYPFSLALVFEASAELTEPYGVRPLWSCTVATWGKAGKGDPTLMPTRSLTDLQKHAARREAGRVLEGVGEAEIDSSGHPLYVESEHAIHVRVFATVREAQEVAQAYNDRSGPPVLLGRAAPRRMPPVEA